ncbi:hypothetical protein B0H11DRAFT_2243098 [Mycena galericulata]|nr:hypothetical protein B0H11DRAFT_2243098 [Mycena galericulata]
MIHVQSAWHIRGSTWSSVTKRKSFSADPNVRAEPSTPTPVRHTPATPKKIDPASSSAFSSPQILAPASPDVFSSLTSTSFPAPHFDIGYLNYLAFMQQA